MKQFLLPTLDDLRTEHVLVQAWKKTASHLRQHSWYADTLELDYQSLRLPNFISELQERLQVPDSWESTPLELVPAPKSQTWQLGDGIWKPKGSAHNRIRPLAHVSLPDQVVATAMLLCLADQVERSMGDPLLPVDQNKIRNQVLAYGHRLLCDSVEGDLRHRWGSSKLYRLFFRDYQTFLRRPEVVMEQLKSESNGYEVTLVQSDLSKFYDRVRPALLHHQVRQFAASEDARFFALLQRVFAWGWKDEKRAQDYSRRNGIEGFESVVLPQGLVASGFFANVAIHSVDLAIREYFDRPIDAQGHFILKDACYYVDDFRFVLLTNPGALESEIESAVVHWLQG
ncbi:MAG: RNA-directed DNA polymerase, partial [Terracidiphilus sp.]